MFQFGTSTVLINKFKLLHLPSGKYIDKSYSRDYLNQILLSLRGADLSISSGIQRLLNNKLNTCNVVYTAEEFEIIQTNGWSRFYD